MTQPASGPRSRSPLGMIPAFIRDPLGFVSQLGRDYGPVIAVPAVPGVLFLILNPPDCVLALLVDQSANFEKPPPFKKVFGAVFGNGLFFSEGAFWKRQRKLMQPAFHHKQIQSYAEIMTRHTTEM